MGIWRRGDSSHLSTSRALALMLLHKKSLPQQNCAAGFYIKYGVALFAHFFADAFLAKDAEGDGSGKEDGRECAEYHTEYHGEGK